MKIQGNTMNLNEKSNSACAKMIQDMKNMDNVIKILKKELHEAVAKQHEAMSHATRLAKKNHHLKDELRDIDRLAIAIDKECNAAVKEYTEKVSAAQEKLHANLHKIYQLEKIVSELKKENRSLRKNIEELQKNSKEIKNYSEKMIKEKDEKIFKMELNEKELLQRMKGISKTIQNQRERIVELENYHKTEEYQKDEDGLEEDKVWSQRICIRVRSRNCSEAHDEDFNNTDPSQSREIIENTNHNAIGREEIEESNDKERDWELIGEKHDIRRDYERQQQNLLEISPINNGTRSGINSRSSPPIISCSMKNVIADLEHERDMAKADVQRSKNEIISLRERLEIASEIQQEERSRYEQFLTQEEDRVKRLEEECRNLHKSQNVLCEKVQAQEECILKLKEELNTATKDLRNENYLNRQLRSSNEEVKCSLQKAEEKVAKLQEELDICHQQIKEIEKNQRSISNGTSSDSQNSVIKQDNGKGGQQENVALLESQLSNLKLLNEKKKESIFSLEKLLYSTKNENLELKTSNRQLQLEVERLQTAVSDLQKSLESEYEEVRYYQGKAQKLSAELESIKRTENNIQPSRNVLEEETRLHSSCPIHTRLTIRKGEWQGSKENNNRCSNSKGIKNAVNREPWESRRSGIPKEKNISETVPEKKSCSLKMGNCIYDFEVEGNVTDTNSPSTYRLNQQNIQISDKEGNRENSRMASKINIRRNRCASPKLHVQAGLPFGSEVSLEYEEQEHAKNFDL